MKKLVSVLVATATLVSANAAFADLRQGAKELGVNVTGGYTSNDNNSDSGDLGAQVSFGYFILPKIQVGLSFMDILNANKNPVTTDYYGHKSGGGWTTNNTLNIATQAKFYFPWERNTDIVHGYIGPHIGATILASNKSTETGLAYGGFLGLDAFITEDVALNGEVRYTKSSLKDSESSQSFDSDDIRGLFGIKIFFGGR